MLMVMHSRLSTPVKLSLVNCEPWSLLNASGLPKLRRASSRQLPLWCVQVSYLHGRKSADKEVETRPERVLQEVASLEMI